jgi:hypothetical protein
MYKYRSIVRLPCYRTSCQIFTRPTQHTTHTHTMPNQLYKHDVQFDVYLPRTQLARTSDLTCRSNVLQDASSSIPAFTHTDNTTHTHTHNCRSPARMHANNAHMHALTPSCPPTMHQPTCMHFCTVLLEQRPQHDRRTIVAGVSPAQEGKASRSVRGELRH